RAAQGHVEGRDADGVLGDGVPLGIEDDAGEIVGFPHDRRERGAPERRRRLVGNGDEAGPHHLERDRIIDDGAIARRDSGGGHRLRSLRSAAQRATPLMACRPRWLHCPSATSAKRITLWVSASTATRLVEPRSQKSNIVSEKTCVFEV